jgi:hypothetical protein
LKLWCGLMLTACWSGAAVAQTSPLRNMEIFLGNVLTYDDNVFRTPDGVTRPGTTHGSDWILEPTASINYTRPLARGSIGARAQVSYKFYRHNSDLNRENIDFGLNGTTAISLCDVNGEATFRRSQSDLADVIDGAPAKNVENRTRFNAGVQCGLPRGISPGLEYTHEIATNGSSIRQESNSVRDTLTGRIGYRSPTLGFVSFFGTISDGRYPNRPSPGLGLSPNDQIRTYSGGISYSREIGTRLSGVVSIGYMKVKPKLATVPGHKGITYSGNLSYRGSDRISATLNFSRASQQSNLLGIDYSITTSFGGNINYVFSPVISVTANASFTKRDFTASSFLVQPVGSGDKTRTYGATINFQSFRRLRFAINGTHFIRSSPIAGLDYTANRVSLTSGINF